MFWWTLALLAHAEEVRPPDTAPPAENTVLHYDPVGLRAALDAQHRARRRDQIGAMTALLTWSTANIGVGAVGWGIADDPEWKAFHQMSVAWNAVNVAIAVPGLVGALRDRGGLDLRGELRAGASLRTSFAVNAGLDTGWVAVGAWMAERGLRTGDARLTGFGRSMMMQGGFLLVFDTTMWLLRGSKDRRFTVSPYIGPMLGVGIGGTLGGPPPR